MKKMLMILTLIVGINIVPTYGLNMIDNSVEIENTFRLYVTNPIKV